MSEKKEKEIVKKEGEIVDQRLEDIDAHRLILDTILQDPSLSPSDIENTLEEHGIYMASEDVRGVIEDLTFGSSTYGKDFDLIGESEAKVKYQAILNNMHNMYDMLYEILEIAKARYEEGIVTSDELMTISKEIRQREKLMLKILKELNDQPYQQVNAQADQVSVVIGNIDEKVQEEIERYDSQ